MKTTPEITTNLWRTMCRRYGTIVVPKSSSALMRLVGAGLHAARIMSYATFMSRYTTIIGRRIYPCFTVGEGAEEALWRQIVICVHEHQHRVQARRDGYFGFTLPYLFSKRRRAIIEAEAYRCNLEMHWWRDAQMPDPDALAARLAQYGCDAAAIAIARNYLRAAADEIRRGETRNEATLAAIACLEDAQV